MVLFSLEAGSVANLTTEDAPPLGVQSTARRLTLQTALTVWMAQVILTFFQAGIKHERPLDDTCL